ncbi:MAG: adenine phosphoribosyltransferase [Desulfobacteraceae bacterium]|jgi:adenine phosphoribosyltransferase
MDLKEKIRAVPHWPIDPVTFRDITTLLQDPEAFKWSCDMFYNRYKEMEIEKVVGIDARGFLFGAVLAYKLDVGFTPVRKKGKLPPPVISQEYTLEYGNNVVEMSRDGVRDGERVVIVDDLIATGGTAAAAVNLVEKMGGDIVECAFVIDLPDLKGKEKLNGHNVFSLVEFEGE